MYVPKLGDWLAVHYYGNESAAYVGRVAAIIPAGVSPDKALVEQLFKLRRASTKRRIYEPVRRSQYDRIILLNKIGSAYSFVLPKSDGSHITLKLVDEWGEPL